MVTKKLKPTKLYTLMLVSVKTFCVAYLFHAVVEGHLTLGTVFCKEYVNVGRNASLVCSSKSKNIIWNYNANPLNTSIERYNIVSLTSKTKANFTAAQDHKNSSSFEHILIIRNVSIYDIGNYSCNADNITFQQFFLQPLILPKIVKTANTNFVKQKVGLGVILFCVFEVYPQNNSIHKNLRWLKDQMSYTYLDQSAVIIQINSTHLNFTIGFTEVYKKENGTYECVFSGTEIIKDEVVLYVLDVPQVSIDYAKAVGAHKIFLNWTVNDGNDPILKYFIQYAQEGSPTFTYYKDSIGGKNTSYILNNFSPNSTYVLRISAKNSVGSGPPHQYHLTVRTLTEDPIFIPKVESTGSTSSTITIGWNPPPQHLLEFIQYYELIISESGDVPKVVEETVYQQNSRNLPYMFDNLKTATEYEFKVRACSELTKNCGPWSDVVNGTTMDGTSSQPTELEVECIHHNISRLNVISIAWNVPKVPNGKIISYLISLEGTSMYNLDGKIHFEKWGPKIRRVDEPHHKVIYDGVSPNTNYTVSVSAITRHKKAGEIAQGKCSMPVSIPEVINRIMWSKIKIYGKKYLFKLYLPKISERNGPICCYRIYIVKMKIGSKELPHPEELNITNYHEVHDRNNTLGGVYMAEMISGQLFKSEIFLGDSERFTDDNEIIKNNDAACRKCFGKSYLLPKHNKSIPTEETISKIFYGNQLTNDFFLKYSSQNFKNKNRSRRNPKAFIATMNETTYMFYNQSSNRKFYVFDGEIDADSNYTGFLEIIVRDNGMVLSAYSDYFDVISPNTEAEQNRTYGKFSTILNFVVEASAILIGVTAVVLITLCFLHHYNKKNAVPGQEAISLRDSLRVFFNGRSNNHSHFVSSVNYKGFDAGPIHKSELLNAYKNRHKDTDYGFLREYEMLPNRFSDRTTKNSDMKENSSKNRYPDIKAYDQTRVKLTSNSNEIHGSDYINANFVIGYKERKKFICAQGPMESTIDDFWRMIWEQHLEIIVMLTNLEEYNKAKCAKYWPEKVMDVKQFGDITVKFSNELKTGDYLIRTLDVLKGNVEDEQRQITQYHYLTWKDFMAPEHPHGIIKFIRKINSIYSLQRGPILVHCSAGVGRTGTLVALDSLIQQLDEEDAVSIFNTVCDLRHQRNFLVQSLKQYIFLYRALVDTATFENTEISAKKLALETESLKFKPNDGKDKSKLEMQFEKLDYLTDELNKSCSVGKTELNMSKNRSDDVVPYDRNRVILSPMPLKDNSTYINASFIEGYHNSDTYIITQDPLENTIADFWRMISEQSVSTLVMISEVGEGSGKCPRYWADDEIQYDHILVKYVHSESCPYYTRREFHVINCKIDDILKVTQFQYNGWPTVDGEVPEVCRGINELVDQALKHYSNIKRSGCRSPLTVHCSVGADRSSIFVAMCILVQQLRFEKNVDICATVRKLRSQRPGLINKYKRKEDEILKELMIVLALGEECRYSVPFIQNSGPECKAQYEFLHRAITNYSDLHNLSEVSD